MLHHLFAVIVGILTTRLYNNSTCGFGMYVVTLRTTRS